MAIDPYFDNSVGGTLDKLLQEIIDGVGGTGKIFLVQNYTIGDSYATISASPNNLGEATITSASFTGPTAGTPGLSRKITFDGVTGIVNETVAGGLGDCAICITDGASRVLCVTDETSEQALSTGNDLNFPAFEITAIQPTLAA